MDAALDLHSWQQAFEQHPVSKTRTIEKQLRASVANNRERLRVLVGGNYRELLSTAEQIVALDGKARSAESHISEIGQQCKPPSHTRRIASDEPRRKNIAQLRLLQRCIAASTSSLSAGNLLQAARLLVIARLLVKSLNDEETPVKSLPTFREKAASLRRQLLRRIDATLIKPRSTAASTANASCAYCLITSASFQDVFKHVSRLRLERMRKWLEPAVLQEVHVIDALRYQIATLRMLASLTGRTMTDALGSLQKRAILQEASIMELDLLDLRGIGALIPEEIQTFIPYFKRTPFSADEVRETLLTWSSDASPVIARGLEQLLLDQTEVGRVLELRKALFVTLLPVYFTLPGSSSVHHALRRVLSDRIEILIQVHIKELQSLVESLPTMSTSETDPGSLWEEDFARLSLGNGATKFLHQIHRRRRGATRHLDKTTRSLSTWISSTKELLNAFQELQKTRWGDMLEEPDDEQEEEAEKVVKELSKDDAGLYSIRLQNALKSGFEELEDALLAIVTATMEQKADVRLAVEYLRAIREFVVPLREDFPDNAPFQKLDGLIPRLHEVIAAEIVLQACAGSDGDSDVKTRQGVVTSIENLPSPRAFGFLHKLCTVMLEVGGIDIWSSAAVRALKSAVAAKVFQEDFKHAYAESALDEAYLAAALGHPASTSEGSAEQKKAAWEYWGRTKLLFGVLSE